MPFMVIAIEEKRYYFYYEGNRYWAKTTDNEFEYYLTENEAKQLLNDIFTSNLTFSHTDGEYAVYLDEDNNKRFFKNGKEDYIQFFKTNGESAIVYDGDKEDKNMKDVVIYHLKKFAISLVISLQIVGTVTLGNLLYYEYENRVVPIKPIKLQEAISNIDTSPNLNNEQKSYFKNIHLLKDVLRIADNSRSNELRDRLHHFGIKYFEEDPQVQSRLEDNIIGFYNRGVSTLNYIFLKDGSVAIFDAAAAHEFVHLLQDSYNYSYIIEACAEIMAYEYFGSPISAYKEAIPNVTFLMEIIGPKPVMECNFRYDKSSFVEAIRQYLSEEDTNTLLQELSVYPPKADHDKIRQLLVKMANKKFEGYEDKEERVKQLEINTTRVYMGGFYFNQESSRYSERLRVKYSKQIPFDIKNYKNIKSMSIVKRIDISEVKEIFENDRYKLGVLYVSNSNPIVNGAMTREAKRIDVTNYKDLYPGNYYEQAIETIKSFNYEGNIYLNYVERDYDRMVEELSKAEKYNEYCLKYEDGAVFINVGDNGNLYIEEPAEMEILSIDELFPEQSVHYYINQIDENATYIPIGEGIKL